MNVKFGGKNVPNIHDMVIPHNNPHSFASHVQSMEFPAALPPDHCQKEHERKPKGICIILEEPGLVKPGQKIVGECKDCKLFKSRKPHLGMLSKEEVRRMEGKDANDSDKKDWPEDCCMCHCLSLQSDFKNEKSMLELVRLTFPSIICFS